MGGGDHNKRPQRPTKRLDAGQLAGLTRKAAATAPPATKPATGTGASKPITAPPPPTIPPGLSIPRAMTVEDPMTTQLLAEVARRSETRDFDDDLIDEALEAVDTIDKPASRSAHPHTTKRKRKV